MNARSTHTMLRLAVVLAAVLALSFALVACQSATPTVEPTVEIQQPTVAVQATEVPLGTTAAATGAGTLLVAKSATLGDILTDATGRTVYLFTSDTPNTSTCTGTCLDNWLPVTIQGQPVASEGVDATLLGTLTRDDGKIQVTYKGWPLYNYSGDVNPGDTNGEEVQSSWYAVTPLGEKAEAAATATP